jgi:radical SAM protein with 4Fe4S-binding SPASM domain
MTTFNIDTSHKKRNVDNESCLDIFGEIELSLSRTCDKQCVSCPHSEIDYRSFNKQEVQFMSMDIVDRIVEELRDVGFSGQIDLAGLGEPTLHPDFLEIFEKLTQINDLLTVRLVTNGYKKKFGSSKFIDKMYKLMHSRVEILISVYNRNDIEYYNDISNKFAGKRIELKEIFLESDPIEDIITNFSLNNRAGSVPSIDNNSDNKTCYYPFFMLFVSPDGDYQYCPHDWKRNLIIGNINDIGLLDMWRKKTKQRELFLNYRRNDIEICNVCNVKGTLIGGESFDEFKGELI